MFFLYFKSDGRISVPVRKGDPDIATLNKEVNCGIGSGVNWNNVDLFYAPDENFDDPDDFQKYAATGKYYIENNEIKENLDWKESEEHEL